MSVIGQWSQATIAAVSPNTATLSITAASQSGGNTTYTYTVTQGSVASAISGGNLYVVISGMADAGNNGFFTATTFGSGTFTVANASGVTRAGQSGTGICPSDSGTGVVVFGTSDGLNSYFFQVGTNSYGGDGRLGFHELWKLSGNVGTIIGYGGGQGFNPPNVNDVIAISVETQNSTQIVTAWLNGVIMTPAAAGGTPFGSWSLADSTLSTGTQGINSFSVAGPNQYNWTMWNTSGGGGLPVTTPGNIGTQASSYLAGNVTQTQLASDSFAYTNGDLHTKNANWVYVAGSLTVSSNKVYCSNAAVSGAYRSDVSPAADQYSEVTAVVTGSAATQNCGPAVRMSSSANTYYCIQYANNVFSISKMIAGTFTSNLVTATSAPITGDVIRLSIKGNVLTAWRNGIAYMSVVDNSIASGNVGVFGAGNSVTNGYSAWNGGNYTWTQTQSDGLTSNANWTTPKANNSENTPNLTQASLTIGSGVFSPAVSYAGVAQSLFSLATSTPYSVPDCRTTKPSSATSRTVAGTAIYDVQTSSNPAIPPVDSRTAGAPVDCRLAANIPQNSRTPGTYGPGE